ncbi:hypothetical protein QWY22_10590 [Planococcus liqunii]|uniref:hypothetical protein n=1 Tax=Planococcus liqunii TaxID=3058394 RepID=UPI002628DE43|nr:hypothetical protein [Planococcus sp. N056]WKA49355.1 hypothetical protein QWY22_10590 [Planococcus sp. N056]
MSDMQSAKKLQQVPVDEIKFTYKIYSQKGAEDMDNWFTDLYGEEAFKDWMEELTEKGLWDVNKHGEKYLIRVSEQEGTLIIALYDRETGEGYYRMFPVGGFDMEKRKVIAEKALAYVEEDLPIMWKEIISPLIGGYWEDEEWDVTIVHNIDRSRINPGYRNYLK